MSLQGNQPVPQAGAEVVGTDNRNGQIFPALARTESADPSGLGAGIYVSDEMHNGSARGLDLFVDTTSSGAGTLTVKVQKKDPITGTWYDLTGAVTAAINDPADVNLTIYPGLVAVANLVVNNVLGLIWRVHATVAGASVTFSVSGVYLK